jgi:cyclic beta-1,2-glucan synthetase
LALLEKYCDRHFVERAFEMAWFQSQEVLRHLNATEADAQVFGRLASSVIYGNALRRAAPGIIARNRLGQSGLWRFAISGDLPIVLLHIGDLNRIDLVKQVLQAHAYWRLKGLAADLVIVNEDFSGYRAVLQDLIMGLINAGPEAQVLDKPGGVFVRRAEELSEDERVLLQTVARIVFSDTAETLIEQVERRVSAERASDRLEPALQALVEPIYPLAARERIFSNGLGGFTPDGHEYVVTLEPGQTTPAPWVNVIASPHIGTVVSESGSAYTWAENAHEFRLTTWHNDPLSDTSGEALYIRDEETGAFWSPTPLPARGKSGYVCRHGFGYSVFEHYEAGIASELFTYVAMDAPVKFVVVKLRNQSKRARSLSLTGYWELVLGEWRHANLMHIVTETDPHTGALFARNAYGRECANRVVFAHVSERERSVSGNRTEFIGRNGSLASPAAMRRKRLSGRTGAGFDPCAAIQTGSNWTQDRTREVVFVFGAARDDGRSAEFHPAFRRARGRTPGTGGRVGTLEPHPGRGERGHAGPRAERAGQRLAGLSDALLQAVGAQRLLPVRRRLRLPRPVAGHHGAGPCDAVARPRATAPLRRAPVHQGRRAALVAPAQWPGRAHPFFRRLSVAALCRLPLCAGDRRHRRARRVHPFPGRPRAVCGRGGLLRPAATLARSGQPLRALRARPQARPALRRPSIAADGLRRLERRHESRRQGRPGESVWLAWFLLENLELFAGLARDRNDRNLPSCAQARRRNCAATSRPRPGTAPGTGAPTSTTARP